MQDKEEWLQGVIRGLQKRLRERSESDEWLQSELANYQERVNIQQEQQIQQKKEYAHLDEVLQKAREQLTRQYGELGKHEQKKTSHEQQIEDRKTIVMETSRRHNIRGYEINLDEVKINEYLQKITKLSAEQKFAVEKAQKETEREMAKVQEVLRALADQKSDLTAEQNSSKQQVTANELTIRRERSDVGQMNGDEGEVAIIESRIEQLESSLQKVRDESAAANWNKVMEDNDVHLRGLDEETNRLNSELLKGTKHAGDLAQLDHVKKELADRQRSLEKLKAVHKGKLQALLNHKWQPSAVEADFQKCLHNKSQQVKDAEQQRALVSRELEQVDHEFGNAQKSFDNSRKERDDCESRLREVVEEPQGYPTELAEIQDGRDVLKSDADGFVHLRGFYEQAITLAGNRHKCRLCTRGFNNSKEVEQFVIAMREKMKEEDFVKTKSDLTSQEELLRKAKEVGPAYDTWNRLTTTELPGLERTLRDLSSRRAIVVRVLEEHDQTVNDRELAKADIDSIAKPVANIAKYDQEIASLSGQIQDLTVRQDDSGLPRTLEEIRQQLESVSKKYKQAVISRDRLSADKERLHSRLNTIELELANGKGNLSKANYQLERRTANLTRIEKLNAVNQLQREAIRKLDDQLRDLTPQLEAERDQLNDIKQQGREKEAKLRDESSKMADSVYRLKQAEIAIHRYVDDGCEAEMARCQREIESTERHIQRTDQEQKKVIKSLNIITEDLKSQEEIRRTIEENISYRGYMRDLETVRSEVAKLSAENAEADQTHWKKEAGMWQSELNKASTEQTSKLGAAKAKDDQLASLIEDWNTDYKDAAYIYKKAHIEVEVRSMCCAIRSRGLTINTDYQGSG